MVTKPSHYDVFDGTEAIELIAYSLTRVEFRGYILGNILKYRLRVGGKDNVMQEIRKAIRSYEPTLNLRLQAKSMTQFASLSERERTVKDFENWLKQLQRR